MLLLNESDIINSISIQELLKAVEEAFLIQESGEFNMPNRMHVEQDGNVQLLMPCSTMEFFSTKLVSVFPGNRNINKPAIYGTVILNDGNTGEPLAVLNGSKLTALRTGAVGALGLLYTTPKNISTLGLAGAGVQGFHQVLFSCAVREIKKVYIHDPFSKKLDKFISDLQAYLPQTEFTICSNPRELVETSEAIITSTTSMEPVLPDEADLYKRKHILGIGSYKPQMQELPNGLFSNLDSVVVDTEHAKKESGDLSIRLENGLIKNDQIFTLGKLINKEAKIDENKTTLFKSVGMALFDLIVAKAIFQNALEKNIGTVIEF